MPQSQNNDNIELTSDQVRKMTIEALTRYLNLMVDGYKFNEEDIWNVTVAAAAQGQAIESAANHLEGSPDPSTVRLYLRSKLVDIMMIAELEDACNQVLVDNLPPGIQGEWHKVAIDLTSIPYHGQAAQDPKEIRRGIAKSGTTHFHCYATAYVIKSNKRVTLALTYVKADDTLVQVLERILTRLKNLDVHLERLYLDKQFYCITVINYFQTQYPKQEVIIPALIRGKQGGTRSLLRGRKSYITTHTMRSPKYGEAIYRIALGLVNIWVFLKWAYVSYPRRGGRDARSELFPLTMFKQFLLEAIKAIYGAVTSISLSMALPQTAEIRTLKY